MVDVDTSNALYGSNIYHTLKPVVPRSATLQMRIIIMN